MRLRIIIRQWSQNAWQKVWIESEWNWIHIDLLQILLSSTALVGFGFLVGRGWNSFVKALTVFLLSLLTFRILSEFLEEIRIDVVDVRIARSIAQFLVEELTHVAGLIHLGDNEVLTVHITHNLEIYIYRIEKTDLWITVPQSRRATRESSRVGGPDSRGYGLCTRCRVESSPNHDVVPSSWRSPRSHENCLEIYSFHSAPSRFKL